MKPVVELISEWDSYQETHPDATVAGFCRHYLAMVETKGSGEGLFSGIEPPDMTSTVAKLIGRLGAMLTTYSKLALKEDEEVELDWFYCLNAIFHQGEARKIDIITYNFLEQTTGIDMLNRLRKAGYISERADPSDKRAKLVQLTAEGKQLLFRLYERLYLPAYLLFGGMSKVDSHLMVNLLGPIEQKHGKILEDNRAKGFADLVAETLGPEKLEEINSYQQNQITQFAAGKQ
ncbi:DNA-binding MarR family transcriptional regulator [Dyadobacter sp. BE34]|uniref:DNA-binding MarR family transcriptional regulator n=1 Tax=Dyadobacter fermentans TaxID=94254 RepID=A0ABU1QUN7_9BACT|nr:MULTISPECIES: winged helix DNA-binding protein [Dyadobacter]MDR6804882.1 DNA-binding MarR family transcriptional regulator [Dyadobacter fermentans]MDR7043359.1 DNA-binding MarR family transcriptional regulator [Dyadobacter sp. BE242]MDR7197671.1 DNA-binding MarR family transcriptional regulator [Dyadobacter sp. BE34]MDR7214896.1 DNA-binding MarR family transcriptional regulator [Dyadobacter sp. BE31]MDR7262431.1 DNA-binding MarR family transcriptional regulator [Dyadobacter sp. BE32]